MKKFLLMPIVRGIVTFALPILISVLVSLIAWSDLKWDTNTVVKFVIFLVVALLYLSLSVFYIIVEKKIKDTATEKENRAKREAIEMNRIKKMDEWLSSRLQEGMDKLAVQTKELKEAGRLNLDLWGFELECQYLCKYLCETLIEKGEISVFCTQRQKNKKNHTYLMYAGYSTSDDLPQRYRQSVDYTVAKDYYYVKSFDEKETIIFLNSDEIQMKFTFKETRQQSKYRQYISVPIYASDREIIARIEIVTYNDTTLASDEEGVKKLLKQYVSPVIEWIRFSYQVQLALSTETPGSYIK